MSDKRPEDTYKQIEVILLWYWEHGSKDQSIEQLLGSRDRLAILSFRLAQIAAQHKRDYNGAFFLKTIKVERSAQAIMKSGLKYNKAKGDALLENENFYKMELDRESDAYEADLLLRQVNQCLQAMQQRIAYINKEKQDLSQNIRQ